jgi:hypothetical protein
MFHLVFASDLVYWGGSNLGIGCKKWSSRVAYRQDLLVAARRHFRAANELHDTASAGAQPGCKAVAGYLFGLSGELAVKAMMRDSGMAPLPNENRRDDPYYAHFPELKERLKDVAAGRRAGELREIAESPALFRNWDTQMRYAPTADIRADWISAWKTSATNLILRMDTV